MLHCYAACLPGPYHIENGISCQDSFHVIKMDDDIIIAAVCDGLGSMSKSDVGSFIASVKTVEYCAAHYKKGLDFCDVKKIMNNAFVNAYKNILNESNKKKEDSEEYDTTVCIAIYDSGHLYYGQSGDSGLVALMNDGHYIAVTEQQRDPDGYVFPLCSGPEKWVFGEVDGEVSSVMLMTDGVWDQICPKVLKDQAVNINVPLAQKFMDRQEREEKEIALLQEAVYKYLDKFPRRLLDDDKTVVVIYNPDFPATRLDEEYYFAPNWSSLKEKAEKNLYVRDYSEKYNCCEKENPESYNESTTETDVVESVPEISSVEDDITKKIELPDISIATNEEGNSNSKKKTIHNPSNKYQSKSKLNNKPVNGKSNRICWNFKLFQKTSFNTIALVCLVCFSLFAFFFNSFVKEHMTVSCLGILVVCFLANATVLLPAPSIFIVIEYSMQINPIAVALCGAIGASLGEMIGFFTGENGRCLVKNEWIEKMSKKFPKHPYLFVFVFSALPLPLFDVVGLLAGITKLNKIKFYLVCLIGKLIKMLCFVTLGNIVSNLFV